MNTSTYLFNRISSISFFRGWFPFYRARTLIDPVKVAIGKKMIWRNHYTSTLKFTKAYMDRPVELGNFLFLRTRERDFLRTRIMKPSETVCSKLPFATGADTTFLTKVETDLSDGLKHLETLLTILSAAKKTDLPVSFASYALYAMEKNGLRNEKIYKNLLFPVLKAKAQYLHAEGLSSALWALGKYESKDNELINTLLARYDESGFGSNLMYVKNAKYSTENFLSAQGSHAYENESTEKFRKLYFDDNLSCLELYEGLKNISYQKLDKSASASVAAVIANLEDKQPLVSDSYAFYKQLADA